jgi:hypothetical protein
MALTVADSLNILTHLRFMHSSNVKEYCADWIDPNLMQLRKTRLYPRNKEMFHKGAVIKGC